MQVWKLSGFPKTALAFAVLFSLMICILHEPVGAQTMPSTQPSGPTIWTLDNTGKIGGNSPEVFGSPKVVDSPAGKALQFDGAADGLLFDVNPLQNWPEFTIEVLIKPDAGGPKEQRFLHVQDDDDLRGTVELRMTDKGWALDTFLLNGDSRKSLLDETKLHPADKWTWVALVYVNGKMTSYVNGTKELEGDVTMGAMGSGKISLGVRQNKVSWYKGLIREVRFTPAGLPSEKLNKLP